MSIRRRRWPAHPVPVAPMCILVLICALAVPAGVRPVAAQDPCPPGAPPQLCLLPHERHQPHGPLPAARAAGSGGARAAAVVTAGPVGVPADVDIADLGTLGSS